MEYVVVATPEFDAWVGTLDTKARVAVARSIDLLRTFGTELPFPYCSGIEGAALRHLRELRVQSKGRPIRVLYAFDPRRSAILLCGGDKTGDAKWYPRAIKLAEKLYAIHLKKEGI